ncbi:macrolide family glycosyltransferase [Saccharomonospora cyanea]|uniref:Glycosyltransferase, MGT family n=1 Tax=Saccharomonospora cyanea NA-134 TaxID=882082 RepID=H5XHU1_9PSEU|nr:macrolide family glycosyltransferase [Saccharomonospora cyanea]EHR62800.1 glycosyltransferase, MGT family [Saccharomonospora cyanea NA-134]
MPRKILFLCHPDHGHVIPSLAMVAELVRRGHEVLYLTAPSMRDIVAATGATVLAYDSHYRDADFTRLAEDPGYLLSVLLDESAAMLHTAVSEVEGIGEVAGVVYDTSVLYAGRILSRRWGVPSVQLIPFFASNEKFSYLNAMYNDAGGDGPATEKPAELPEWVGTTMRRIGELSHAHGVDTPPHELWFEVPECSLVTIPREFQYEGDSFDERFTFVGPCVGDRDFLGEWTPPGGEEPVVLVSLGAVFNEHEEIFRACVEAFRGRPWHAVLTVAEGTDPESLGALPPNVEVHRWVPHVTVLEHAALCVTHGGMGTVMEALRAGTPLVCVPTSALDRPTGWRIGELGLGVVIDPADITPEVLAEAVRSVLADRAAAEAAERMSKAVAEAGGAARAAERIEDHLARGH